MTLANGLREPAQIGDTALGGLYRLAARTTVASMSARSRADLSCVGCAASESAHLCAKLWSEASCGVGVWHPVTEQTELELETKGEE